MEIKLKEKQSLNLKKSLQQNEYDKLKANFI